MNTKWILDLSGGQQCNSKWMLMSLYASWFGHAGGGWACSQTGNEEWTRPADQFMTGVFEAKVLRLLLDETASGGCIKTAWQTASRCDASIFQSQCYWAEALLREGVCSEWWFKTIRSQLHIIRPVGFVFVFQSSSLSVGLLSVYDVRLSFSS